MTKRHAVGFHIVLQLRVGTRAGNEQGATVESDGSAAMPGQDAIISALGAGKSVVSDMYPHAAKAVIDAAQEWGVKTSGVDVIVRRGRHTARNQLRAKGALSHDAAVDLAQKEIADSLIRTSGPDWTLVYPVGLTHGPATGSFRVGDHLSMKGYPISRADVAAFMLEAARGSEWVRRSAVISD